MIVVMVMVVAMIMPVAVTVIVGAVLRIEWRVEH
jgi:hypothetical protein